MVCSVGRRDRGDKVTQENAMQAYSSTSRYTPRPRDAGCGQPRAAYTAVCNCSSSGLSNSGGEPADFLCFSADL